MSGPPSLQVLLAQWLGTGMTDDPFFSFDASAASNLVFGGNPPFEVFDFLAIYPKFGTQPQALAQVAPNAASPGSGYNIGDLLAVVQAGASGGVIGVQTTDGLLPPTPNSYAVSVPGTGYYVGTGLTTTGGAGTGAKIDILSISPYSGPVPETVIQLFINLASASLQQARWLGTWRLGMALFVAHFLTLYLDSEGNVGSLPGQIAASGIAKGIAVSKSVHDVSISYETITKDLEGFAAWSLTKYGQQLATFAKIIGMGPMYVY